jgi:hypothetical protein
MKIIGIHGPSRSGKDTICQILLEEFPLIKFQRQGFADALKISAALALGLRGPNDHDAELLAKMDKIKESGEIKTPFGTISGRQFLQNYGTEAHRTMFDEDFWVDAVIPDPSFPRLMVSGVIRDADVLLIPDVRYQNEIQRVIDAGGYLWKVNKKVNGNITGHASETELEARWDRVIDNNGTLDDLRSDVKNAFNKIANQIINDRVTKVFS